MAEAITWEEYVGLARRYLATGKLDDDELNRKRSIAAELRRDREQALAHRGPVSITARTADLHWLDYWANMDAVRRWLDTEGGAEAARALWAREDRAEGQLPPDGAVIARIRAFSSSMPADVISGAGSRLRTISVLLMALDAERFPPFKTKELNNAYAHVGYHMPPHDADEGTLYEHALGFFDRVIEELAARELQRPSNRLEAQSVVWGIEYDLPVEEKAEVVDDAADVSDPQLPPDLGVLAEELLFDIDCLRTIEELLDDKRQVIFQGPPGTGKTYVARKLAASLAGAAERVHLVQFHPSYAYEDFVQGYRPSLERGQPGFKLRNGPLLEAAGRALDEPDAMHFLVIDEINRGNLAKVFGELYFLLEYRDEKMRLQYSAEAFALPENLYVIGTMNTADRSIALVDLALRRRFHFVDFHPDHPPVQGLLGRWLTRKAPDMMWVADVVDRANAMLGDGQAAIGPSCFMKDGLDEGAVRLIWEHNVLPYLEERFYGERDRLAEFALSTLRHAETEAAGEDDATD